MIAGLKIAYHEYASICTYYLVFPLYLSLYIQNVVILDCAFEFNRYVIL